MFEQIRKWAYRAIRQGWPAYKQWLQACFKQAKAYNFLFLIPLDEKEALNVANSIAKWTHTTFNKGSFNNYLVRTHTPIIQSIRGKKVKVGQTAFR